jgi:Methylamine utilisation protein MauE
VRLVAGPFAAFALLLAIAGTAKAVRPLPTARALRAAGLPSSASLVRLLGAGEAVLALVALTVAGPAPAALVAISYAGFAAFIGYARARGLAISSCGCFGKPDTPPTAAHLVVDLVAASLAVIAAAAPGRSPLGQLARSPGAGVPFVVLVLVTAALGYLALAEWPRLVAVLRPNGLNPSREART